MSGFRPAAGGSVRSFGPRGGHGFLCAPPVKHLWLLVLAVMAGLASSGCKKAVVPDVEKQDLEQAKQTLAAAQLKPGNITGPQGPGAYVLTQSLAVGQQVSPGSAVDLTVETPVALPDFTRNKVTDAVNSLQDLGLKVAFVKEPALKLFGGSQVVAQLPVAATLVRRGSVVTLTVRTSPDLKALAGIVTSEPAYGKLNPEYRRILDEFLK